MFVCLAYLCDFLFVLWCFFFVFVFVFLYFRLRNTFFFFNSNDCATFLFIAENSDPQAKQQFTMESGIHVRFLYFP